MFETVLPLVLGVNLAVLAAWLTIGVCENLFHPFLNETYTAEVMDMARMRDDYPEAYAHVAYRRITNARVSRALFRLIVFWEAVATCALWAGTAALFLAAGGALAIETALSAGLIGALLFTLTWGGFLVAGNWFCYWFGHEGGQNTHFQMSLWGFANMALLTGGAIFLLG